MKENSYDESELEKLYSEAEYNKILHMISIGLLPKESLDELLGSRKVDQFDKGD